jgi:hypothetical protein
VSVFRSISIVYFTHPHLATALSPQIHPSGKMYQCECCSDCFDYEYELEDHMDDDGHWPECETCPKTFRTSRACDQHMNDTGHWAPEFECETCTRVFASSHAADQHMKALGHYKNYCKACDRFFQNENNLRMVSCLVSRDTSATDESRSISTPKSTAVVA